MPNKVQPTGVERSFDADEFIVTKTDTKGLITYANSVFLRVSAITLEEAIGQPHNLVRHPDMPRGVYKLLWDTISHGHEVFAYVNNLAADGANYWVFAHVTPTIDTNGKITGYHSNRRKPSPAALSIIKPIYRQMRDAERNISNGNQAAEASLRQLTSRLRNEGLNYDQFIWDVYRADDKVSA